MKKSFTSTLIMLGLLTGLTAWYVLYEQKYRPEQKDQEEQSKKLISLRADQISEIKLTRLKNAPLEGSNAPLEKLEYETLQLKKLGQEWLLVDPVQVQADSLAISALLSAVTSAKQERVVEEHPKDLGVFGLTQALIHIELKKDSVGPAEEIWIGIDTPIAHSSYARVTGSENVFKINRSLRSGLDKDLFALRNKNVVDLNRTEVAEIEIQNPKENIILASDSKDNWTLSRENIPAESLEWNKTLSPLLELKAVKVASEKAEKPAEFGLDEPMIKITLVKTDKSRRTILMGKVKGTLFAKRADLDTIFEIDKTLEERLKTPALQYRNKHIAKFDRYEIAKIKLETGKDSIELNKEGISDWKLAAEPITKIDSTQVDALLTKLQDIQLVKYLSGAESKNPIKNPLLKISLFDKKDKIEKEVLALSFEGSKGLQIKVKKTELPYMFEISKEDFDKLNITKQSLLQSEEKPKEAVKVQKKS